MAPPKRITSKILDADRAALFALQDVGEYAPMNDRYGTPLLQALEVSLTETEKAEARARRAYEFARDQSIVAGRAFHHAMLGAKIQVVAQFGEDSHVVEAVGRKKRSNYRRPVGRTALAE